jgi:HNH endonuclease/AP2 domain
VDTISIPLTKGKFAIVDSRDAWVSRRRWHAFKSNHTWYAARGICENKKHGKILMHRAILNAPPGSGVDHINGDGLDNRMGNLRLATQSENAQNCRRPCNNTSGVKGVSWSKVAKKWQAQINVRGNHIHLGYFTNINDAAEARDDAAKQLHGEFATNSPDRYPASDIVYKPT